MKATIELEITQDDIKQGLPSNRFCCPVARAVQRYFKDQDVSKIYVDNDRVLIYRCGRFTYYVLDYVGTSLIRNFDDGRQVLPCIVKMQEDYGY